MSKITDYAKAILAGGLPAALDLGSSAGAKQGDGRTERIAPAGTLQDRDREIAPVQTSVIDHITGKEIAIGAAGLIIVGAFMYAVIKFAGRKG